MNPHFAYDDEDAHVRHQVWMLDAVTALNELRAARQMGLQTFALWRLGSEDPSLWSIWDHPSDRDAPRRLTTDIPPGDDVDTDGEGDILRITGKPHMGSRTIDMDADNWTATDERMVNYPQPYTIRYYGYKPGEVALTFDDGPDPKWTPKILDILKAKHVNATFMVIGEEAQDNVGLLKREVADGNEIASHTFTHPDISEISQRQVELELNLTERLFASELGIKPLFFRPPYSIDTEPETNDQAAPAYFIQQMGYTIIGNQIDTNDWDERVKRTPQSITRDVLDYLQLMKTKPQFRGSIILLHDGGGDRAVTVATLPVLIDTLRAHGYKIVQVSDLMGKHASGSDAGVDSQGAVAGARGFSCLLRFFLLQPLCGDGLLFGRCLDERPLDPGRHLCLDRSVAPQARPGRGRRFLPASRRAHPRIQRREGDRAHDPVGAELRLHQPAIDCD